MPEEGAECESSTIISIDSLLGYDKICYLQVYLDKCAYEIVNTQINILTMLLSLIKISFLILINGSHEKILSIKIKLI